MAYVKGQSGNPAGRPRKKRPLAETILEQSYRPNPDCPVYSNQQVLSILIWNGLTSGMVHFGHISYKLSRRDWLDLIKWASQHVDGPLIHLSPPDLSTPVASVIADFPESRDFRPTCLDPRPIPGIDDLVIELSLPDDAVLSIDSPSP